MNCPNCKTKARVVETRESGYERKRRLICPACNTYIYTCESIIYSYKPTEDEINEFRKRRKNKYKK